MKTKHLIPGKFIPVLITGLLLAGCSKEKTATNDLIGTWTVGTANITSTVGGVSLQQYFMNSLHLTSDQALAASTLFNQTLKQSYTGTIQIKADNTYIANLGGSTDTGTWSLNSDGTILTVNSSTQGIQTFNIVQLTASALKLSVMNTVNQDLNSDGTPETITLNIELTFNKTS